MLSLGAAVTSKLDLQGNLGTASSPTPCLAASLIGTLGKENSVARDSDFVSQLTGQ